MTSTAYYPTSAQVVGRTLVHVLGPAMKNLLNVRTTVNGNVAVELVLSPDQAKDRRMVVDLRVNIRQTLKSAGFKYTYNDGRFYVTGKKA